MRHSLSWTVLLMMMASLLWIVGCPADDDDSADDDDTGDDDTGDDDTGDDDDDDDTSDDDTSDDDSGDDDSTMDPVVGDDMENRTYFMDLGSATTFTPAQVGPVLQDGMPTDAGLIFMFTDLDDTAGTLTILMGAGGDTDGNNDWLGWMQDPSVDTGGGGPLPFWSNPGWTFGPIPDLTIVLGTTPVYMGATTFGGNFVQDGTSIVDFRFDTLTDTQAIDEMQKLPVGTTCQVMGTLGFPCVKCPGGPNVGVLQCLNIIAEGAVCPELDSLVMVPVP